jgi:aminotransferase
MKLNDVATTLMEAISIKYNNLVYEMKSRGEDVIVLSLGEAFFDIPVLSFDKLAYPDLYHYSHSRGLPTLRQKISAYYQDRYGVNADPDKEILMTAGSKIGIYYALLSIVEQGDEVLLLEPYWVSYTEQVRLVGAKPVSVPVGESISNLDRYVSPRTSVLVLNNPQNPTGKNFKRDEIEQIFAFAARHGLWVISDEAYSDFVNPEERFISFGSVDRKFERTIIVNSISKNFGISGWRIGYMLSNPTVIDTALKITQHTMTCAPTVLLMYLDQYFEHILKFTMPQITELLAKRERIVNYLESESLKVEAGNATFYFFVSIKPSRLDSVEFCNQLLANYKVVAVPGIGYGQSCDQFIRISIGTESDERIRAGLKRIRQLIMESS